MRKKIFFISITVILCVVAYFVLHSNIGFKPDFAVAEINSGFYKFNSEIRYYDEDLNLIYTQSLPFCRLGKHLMSLKDKRLMLSDGNDWIGCRDVIEVDTNSGKIKKYYVDQGRNLAMTSNDKYVFASYSARDSIISRCDKNNGEIRKMSIPKDIVGCLYLADDNLMYAFGGNSHYETSNLYIIDPEQLKILKTFDIKDKGYYQKECMKIGDDLYFLNYCTFEKVKNGTKCLPAAKLTKFNTKTYKFEDVNIEKWPRQFVRFGDTLYIAHDKEIYDESDTITLYNLKTGELTIKKLENGNGYIVVDEKNQKLYSPGAGKLSQYDLKTLKLIKSVDIHSKDDDKYCSALFIK